MTRVVCQVQKNLTITKDHSLTQEKLIISLNTNLLNHNVPKKNMDDKTTALIKKLCSEILTNSKINDFMSS